MADVLYPSKSDLDSFLRSLLFENGMSLTQKGYVAPTFYLLKGKTIGGYNYYSTLDNAFNKVKYLTHKGGADVKAAGSITFKRDGTAQTAGINCDFYFAVNDSKLVNLGYKAQKYSNEKIPSLRYSIVRFYTTSGEGPYYAIFDKEYFGASATLVSSYSADKVLAMDQFHREVAILKATHNVLADYLNKLASKKLSSAEQQLFNQGLLRMQALRSEIAQIKGLEVYYSKDGTIGTPLAIPLIAWVVVGAIIAGWAVPKILESVKKIVQINKGYDHKKWIAEQRLIIAQEEAAGRISKEEAAIMRKNLDADAANTDKQLTEAAKPGASLFGEIGEIVKWAAIGLGVYAIANAVGKNKN